MKTLLWLDDSEEFIDASLPVFNKHGFIVLKATNTSRALTLLQTENIDGVLLDVQLQGDENGLELLSVLRRYHPLIKVVVFTGFPRYMDHIRAEEAGALAYFEKVEKSIPLDESKQYEFFEALHHKFSITEKHEQEEPSRSHGINETVVACQSNQDQSTRSLGAQTRMKIKVLFLASNPSGVRHLALDDEIRDITQKVNAAEHRDLIEIVQEWAVRPDDLLQALNQHKPHVVHFSGHGSSSEEIILKDNNGNPKPVSKQALFALFRTLKDNVQVVVLNACFSHPQAEAIVTTIPCAIGMSRAIGDKAAITFAGSFYRALAFGRSIQEAFDQGIAALLLEGIPEDNTPKLLAQEGVSAANIFLINPPMPL